MEEANGDAPCDKKRHQKQKSEQKHRWNRFQVLSPRLAILRGSCSMVDKRFKILSRGRQATASATVAIVYGHLFEPREWTPVYVDQVLEYGDRLFRVSQARNRFADDIYVTTCHLLQEFFVGDYKCRICNEPACLYGNLITETIGVPNLVDGIRKFLDERNFGVFTCQGMSVAIWNQVPSGYFYFDPGPCDESGKRNNNGVACMIRCNDPDGIVEVLMGTLNCKFDSRYCIDKMSLVKVKEIGRAKYAQCPPCPGAGDLAVVDKKVLRQLNPIELQETKQDCTKSVPKNDGQALVRPKECDRKEPIQKIPLTIEITNYAIEARLAAVPLVSRHFEDENYTYDGVRTNVPSTFKPMPDDPEIEVLHGMTHQSSDVYKARGAQGVACCVMAIGFKRVHPVKTWIRKSLDSVLALGDTIFADIKTEKPNIHNMIAADLNEARFKVEDQKLIADVDLITVIGTVVSKSNTILNLKQGVEEFFNNNTGGVLECSTLSCALWTQDGYYYAFDPHSCDINGIHVIEDIKKGSSSVPSTEKKEIGKCCIMRFTSLNTMSNHFLKNLDSSKFGSRYIIRRVEIIDDVPGAREWNAFKPSLESWILNGNIHCDDAMFSDRSRGHQGLAMHVTALVCGKATAPSKLFNEDIDHVIINGDEYYLWCIPDGEEQTVEDKRLTLKKMKKILYFKKCRVTIETRESCIVGDMQESTEHELPNLEDGLKQFFEKYQYGVVEANNKYFAVYKHEEELKDKSKEVAYYIFNQKPNEAFIQQTEPGKKVPFACLVRFFDLKRIADILREQLDSPDNEENRTDFFIHEIKVTSISDPMTHEEIQKDQEKPVLPEMRAYSPIDDLSASLAGSFNQMNETMFKRETRDKQQAANALVTLAMTKLFCPFLWYREVLDDILRMGDKITRENSKNVPDFDEEDPESLRGYLMPTEINSIFHIGTNEITADVEEENTSDKLTELDKDLQEFFGTAKMGIFRLEQIMIPIWKEENVFFAFDPRADETAMIYWFINLDALTEFLLSFSDNVENEFIIDGVNIRNSYSEVEPSEDEEVVVDNNWHNFVKLEKEGLWRIDYKIPEIPEVEINPDGSLTELIEQEENEQEKKETHTAAVCIMAIVFSKVYEPCHWSEEILDEINITGEKLHERSADRLGEDVLVHPNDLINEFFLSNRRINLRIRDCVQAGMLGGRGDKILDIESGVTKFFKKSSAGCLTLEGKRHLAIWTYDNYFYSFKPDVSVMRFENISLLAEQLKTCGMVDTDFEITSVDVLDWNKLPPWKFDPSPAVRPSNLPPLNVYSRLPGHARAILRGFSHQMSEIFPESIRGRQTAANCTVALAMTVIKNPTTWTRKTLDEILAIGVNVHRESLKTSTNKSSTPMPFDIVRIFHIGTNVLAVDVERGTVTGVVAHAPEEMPDMKGGKGGKKRTSSRKNSDSKGKKGIVAKRVPAQPPPPILIEEGLNKFFDNNHAGILITGRFMVAIWRDSGVYFMYDPRPRNSEGVKMVEDENEGLSCVVWFACREPLFDLVIGNINDDEQYAKFEICRVIVRTVPIEPLPSPAGYKATKESLISTPEPECPQPAILPAELLHPQPAEQLSVDLETYFERVDKELSILLGGTHMAAGRFPTENRGLQSSAIAAVAIVVANLHAPSTWTPELIDAILAHGDCLHTECVRLWRPGARNLSPSELLAVFVVGDVRARIQLRRNLTAGISIEHDLVCAFKLFFTTNPYGILHTSNYAIPVMEHWGKYYFLDPSERNKFRKGTYEGTSCLVKCESMEKLAKVILAVCAFKEPTVYTLNAVQVLDLQFFTQ